MEETENKINNDPPFRVKRECRNCKKVKDIVDFYHHNKRKDGLMVNCKVCHNEYSQRRKKEERSLKVIRTEMNGDIKSLDKQGDIVRAIALCYLEDPKSTFEQVARKVGVERHTVSAYFRQNNYLQALRQLATNKVANFIPQAVKSLEDSIDSRNPDVKFKASIRLLENEDILGPTKVDLSVNDLRNRPDSELREIIERAKTIPSQMIEEAELIK